MQNFHFLGTSDNTTYTFTMPAGNVSVEAVFEADILQYVGVLELEAADNSDPENVKEAVTAKAPVFVLNK